MKNFYFLLEIRAKTFYYRCRNNINAFIDWFKDYLKTRNYIHITSRLSELAFIGIMVELVFSLILGIAMMLVGSADIFIPVYISVFYICISCGLISALSSLTSKVLRMRFYERVPVKSI